MIAIDPNHLRRTFGRALWGHPRLFGPSGWSMTSVLAPSSSVIVTTGVEPDDPALGWIHASIAHPNRMPDYGDLTKLFDAVWRGQGWAYQVFAPPADRVNGHPYALHLWGRLDGQPELPNFGRLGTI